MILRTATPSPAVTYRPIGDDAMEKIGKEVSELVIASRPDDCAHLEVILLVSWRKWYHREVDTVGRSRTYYKERPSGLMSK